QRGEGPKGQGKNDDQGQPGTGEKPDPNAPKGQGAKPGQTGGQPTDGTGQTPAPGAPPGQPDKPQQAGGGSGDGTRVTNRPDGPGAAGQPVEQPGSEVNARHAAKSGELQLEDFKTVD